MSVYVSDSALFPRPPSLDGLYLPRRENKSLGEKMRELLQRECTRLCV